MILTEKAMANFTGLLEQALKSAVEQQNPAQNHPDSSAES